MLSGCGLTAFGRLVTFVAYRNPHLSSGRVNDGASFGVREMSMGVVRWLHAKVMVGLLGWWGRLESSQVRVQADSWFKGERRWER